MLWVELCAPLQLHTLNFCPSVSHNVFVFGDRKLPLKRYLRLNEVRYQRVQWQSTPVLLPGKSHGRKCLVGYSPQGCEESDKTEQLHVHFSLSCIGEGNGNPLQYSCLENPMDRGAWYATAHESQKSQT